MERSRRARLITGAAAAVALALVFSACGSDTADDAPRDNERCAGNDECCAGNDECRTGNNERRTGNNERHGGSHHRGRW